MIETLLFSIISFILLSLVVLTFLQLYSRYRTHQMQDIIYTPIEPSYWPTNEWKLSTPEEQGINSLKLLDMIAYYEEQQEKKKDLLIDSLTIIRNNHVIADLYFNPLFPKDEKHIINSCTKSIVSILIGIAIDQGYIKNVDVPVLYFFKDFKSTAKENQLKKLTIKHLLTMRTGWHSQDSYLYQWKRLFKMQATDNWTNYILNLPFETKPNTRFDYSNMASFLLSAILTKAVGEDTLSFAKKQLFTPLGIHDILWDQSPEGIYIGFARLWLKPHDLAKIGLLYLQKGKWENKQVLSESWVESSIKAHSFPKQYRYLYNEQKKKDFEASGGNWVFSNLVRPLTDGYGYQWWLDKSGIFSALGVGGQFLLVVPKENLMIIATSKLKSKDTFLPVKLLKKFIIPAIESQTPLATNEKAYQKLSAYFTPPSLKSTAKPKTKLPPIAHKISHKVFSLDQSIKSNPWQHDNFSLIFEEHLDYAVFSYTMQHEEQITYKVGLDNQFQFTTINGKTYAAMGEWTTPTTFTVSHELIGYSSKDKWILLFNDDDLQVSEMGMTGMYEYQGKMKDKVSI